MERVMGKPTGFMEYKREVSVAEDPKKRIQHFNEFHEHLPKEKQRLQGARCMECGVPFIFAVKYQSAGLVVLW